MSKNQQAAAPDGAAGGQAQPAGSDAPGAQPPAPPSTPTVVAPVQVIPVPGTPAVPTPDVTDWQKRYAGQQQVLQQATAEAAGAQLQVKELTGNLQAKDQAAVTLQAQLDQALAQNQAQTLRLETASIVRTKYPNLMGFDPSHLPTGSTPEELDAALASFSTTVAQMTGAAAQQARTQVLSGVGSPPHGLGQQPPPEKTMATRVTEAYDAAVAAAGGPDEKETQQAYLAAVTAAEQLQGGPGEQFVMKISPPGDRLEDLIPG